MRIIEPKNLPGLGTSNQGRSQTLGKVSSAHLEHDREVLVWLPPTYDTQPDKRFQVIYMPDAQQVFNPKTSTHGKAWEMDRHICEVSARGRIDEAIVVASASTENRREEYEPGMKGREFGRFVTEELKPMVDRIYRTKADRASTWAAGASMGGCISLYLAWVYPHIFGGAACLSSAFMLSDPPFMIKLVKSSDITPDIRIYLYCGNQDKLEKTLMNDHLQMSTLLREKGFREGQHVWIEEDPEGQHNEETWCEKTPRWLELLLQPQPETSACPY